MALAGGVTGAASAAAPAPRARASARRGAARALAVVVLLLLALPRPGAAGSLEQLLRTARDALQAGEPRAAVAHLQARELDYAHAPRYNNLLATAALRAGELATAVTALRRLILLQPNHLGARLDLAIAHARMGDAATARRLLRRLAARDDVPPRIRRVIADYLARLQQPTRPQWRFRAELASRLGHSTNVNNGTEAERIDLRFDGVPVEVRVADASRARADAFAANALTLRWSRPGRWRPRITARVRRETHADASEFDNTLASVGAAVTGPADAAGQWTLRGRYLHFDRRAGDTLDIAALTTQFRHRFDNGVAADLALDLRRERYRNGDVNDGDIARLRLGLGYRGPRWQARLELAAGRDTAVANRAGGDQDLVSAALGLGARLAPGVRLDARLAWRRETDDAPFSPAFFGATRRETRERRARIGATWRLTERLSAVARLAHTDERANIDLFDQRTTRATLGLRWRFQ